MTMYCVGGCTLMFCWFDLGELPTTIRKPWTCCFSRPITHLVLPNKQYRNSMFGWCTWSKGSVRFKWWFVQVFEDRCCSPGILKVLHMLLWQHRALSVVWNRFRASHRWNEGDISTHVLMNGSLWIGLSQRARSRLLAKRGTGQMGWKFQKIFFFFFFFCIRPN